MGVISKALGVDDAREGMRRGLAAQRAAALKAENAMRGGAAGARTNLTGAYEGAQNIYGQGYQDQMAAMNLGYDTGMDYLQEGNVNAMGRLDPLAAMFDPSMANQFSVEGIGQNLSQISDPMGAFGDLINQNRATATSGLSSAGYARSGKAGRDLGMIDTETALGINSMLFGQQMQNPALAAINAQSSLENQFGVNAAGMATGHGANMANIHGMNAQQLAALESGYGSDMANIDLGTASNLANIYTGTGAAEANTMNQMGGLKMGMAQTLIPAAAQAGAAIATSDLRLKKNLTKIGEHKGLGIYSWEWNDKAEEVLGLSGTSVGHIAQEVEDIHPELVHVMNNGYMSMMYNTDKTMSLGF